MAEFDRTTYKLIVVPKATVVNETARIRPPGFVLVRAYISYWRNYTNFRDRTSRAGYWWVVFMNVIIAAALFAFMYMAISGLGVGSLKTIASMGPIAPVVIFAAWPVVNLIPGLALTVRRLHDTGRSFVYYFFAFVPVAGILIMVFFLTSATKPLHINRYGYRPQV